MTNMKRSALVLLILLSSCGPYKVEMEPVKGTLTVSFDLTDITKYFKSECESEVPPEQVDACVNEKVGKFLSLLSTAK